MGKIPKTSGVHGVAVAPEFGRGFISVGHTDSVVAFDLKTLAKIGDIKIGKNPDAIVYDPASKRVFSFNGDSGDATVIEAGTGKVSSTIDIGGKPEAAAVDGVGNVYLDIVDKNLVLQINSRTMRTPTFSPPLTETSTFSVLSLSLRKNRIPSIPVSAPVLLTP